MNNYVLLRIENLKKIYDKRLVLNISSFAFEQGKIYAIVGPNGSGKTTLINILSLLDIPDNGKIFFKEKEIKNISKNDLLKIRRQITLVHQKPFLFQTTVYNNIAYGLKIRGISYLEQEKRIKEVLKIVGLSGFERRGSNQLSGGEAQRVVIARALAIEPDILFLDEPTANIDKRYIEAVERIIKKINRELNTTVIFTTHDLSQAYRLADTIISLLEGRIIQHIPENIFRGKIIQENGLQWCKITEEIKFALVSKRRGYVYIYIAPSDIILSYNQFASSAQNSFIGKVIKISEHNHLIRLVIDIGVELVSVITRDSFLKMNINISSNICLTFKASAVKCF
ncbi:MAG: ATP-binding cassette domain-containing protein [Atribacterota bacterium]|nr:ATP-binding cassette domain-containing protein [Atribacterota bacterium]MDD4896948.1 ATP-binding cassette domain-containing protein [Atribacterota bacterium]MDD5637080.1 ATP-binding cassette domain-containing protein [Atribacterota bacterium]